MFKCQILASLSVEWFRIGDFQYVAVQRVHCLTEPWLDQHWKLPDLVMVK